MAALLKPISDQIAQGSLPITGEALGSISLANSLRRIFSGEEAVLAVRTATVQVTADTVRFQCDAPSLLYLQSPSAPVADVLFYVHAGRLECFLKATLPAAWNFGHSYPNLPDYQHFNNGVGAAARSFFYNLAFAPGHPTRILFSSYDFQKNKDPEPVLTRFDATLKAAEIHQGLNFFVTLDLEKMDWLGTIIQFAEHGAPTLSGRGYMEQPPLEEEQIKFLFDLPLVKQYEDTFEIGISSLLLYTSTYQYAPKAVSGIAFLGGLSFGQSDHPPRNVEIIWPIGSNQLVIRNGEPIPFPGFDAFARLIPDHRPSGGDSRFPVAPAGLGTLFIREISIHLDSVIPPRLSFLTFSVGPAPDWELDFLDGAIAIEDLLLRWDIFFGGGKAVEFLLFGAFRLGGGLVHVSAAFPDFVFQGELGLYQSIELSQIFKHFLPNAPLPEVDILDLNLRADFKQKLYAFEIDIATDWQIQLGKASVLPLKNLRIQLDKADLNTFATIDATLNIGGVDLLLLATNAGQTESGWQLEGSTGRGQAIPIGELIGELAAYFGSPATLPAAVTHLELRNLDAAFHTGNKDFLFVGEAEFPISEAVQSQVDIGVNVDIKHQVDGSFTKRFSGLLSVHLPSASLQLAVVFDKENLVAATASSGTPGGGQTATFLALYQDSAGVKLPVDDLLQAFGVEHLQTGLFFTIKEVLVAYHSPGAAAPDSVPAHKWLFGIDIEGGLNLSAIHIDDLPFVHIPPDQTLKLEFQVLAASQPFSVTEIQALSSLAPNGNLGFPSKAVDTVDLSVTLDLGTARKQIDLPVGLQTQSAAPGGSPPAGNGLAPADQATASTPQVGSGVTVTGADGVRWITVQKQLGPLAFERVGVKYADNQVTALLDTAFSAGGLTIALNGLSVSSPISEFKPVFGLNGLGIDFKNASVEIGGTFLREPTGFAGLAVIRTKVLSLSAIGAYAYAGGQPSLFIYAVLNYPFGGPAFFYVTGIAAGFGYNRRLVVPDIEQVAAFPLVLEATRDSAPGNAPKALPTDQQGRSLTLQSEIQALEQYIPVDNGQYFLAVGLKFTSFKQIDSFALLVVQFGNRFEVDLLGLSTLKVPTPAESGGMITPVAEAQLALKAVFIPSEGFLGVRAQLTGNSYILSRACRLTGGFAFYSWFAGPHDGDFVLTLGGYHPAFNVPDHYPQVPRLGFTWQVSPQFYLRGELYFALTAHALMAGGRLEALFQTDNIKAWFIAGADFLLAWKPYHYEIAVFISMGLDITFEFFGTQHITLSAAADLKLWGPEFGGEAHIQVKVLFFTIPVDVAFGSRAPAVPAIGFTEFTQTYLPADDSQICSVTIRSGLLETVTENGEEIWIVNAKEMVLVTNSTIPGSRGRVFGRDTAWDGSEIGVRPMGVQPDELSSTHVVDLMGMTAGDLDALSVLPIAKKMPAALWGKPELAGNDPFRHVGGQRYLEKPQLNGERFVDDALTGYEIRVGTPPAAGMTHPVAKDVLQSELVKADENSFWEPVTLRDPVGAAAWQAAAAWQTADDSRQQIQNTIRDEFLAAMGLSRVEIDFGEPVLENVAI